MASLSLESIQKLPKTDLHCHLDGSLRLSTLMELAEQQKIELPARDPDKLSKALGIGTIRGDLEDFLKAFAVSLSVLQTEEALYRAAYELAEDAWKESVWYLEVRYAPVLHTQKGLRHDVIVRAVVEGLAAAQKRYGIHAGVILCGIRNQSPELSLEMANLAVAWKGRGVIGFDLAGAEEDFPAKKHAEAFHLIRSRNINCTLHAGEGYGPESIGQAIHWCGAHRIGHGTRLREDPDLMAYVNDHRIPLEVCLTSNVETRTVKSYAEHPLRYYFDRGIRVTVNTDNRLFSDTTVTKELHLAHQHLGFSMEELKEIVLYGFKSAFLPFAERRALLERVAEALGTMGRNGQYLSG